LAGMARALQARGGSLKVSAEADGRAAQPVDDRQRSAEAGSGPTAARSRATHPTLAIATSEWAPFSGKKLYQNGFALHVIREAYARAGFQVKYDFFSWEKAYQAILDTGSVYAASAFWYRSPQRESTCLYSDPVTREEMVFFFRKAAPMESWSTLGDLKGRRLGFSTGITLPADLANLIANKSLEAESAADDETNLRKLLAGHIDLFPTTAVAGLDLLRSKFTSMEREQLDYHRKPIMVSVGHVLFARNNPASRDYLDSFNAGLKTLTDEGTYDEMNAELVAGKYSLLSSAVR
jgi:polar amino acid transport system substrate-binding protein